MHFPFCFHLLFYLKNASQTDLLNFCLVDIPVVLEDEAVEGVEGEEAGLDLVLLLLAVIAH